MKKQVKIGLGAAALALAAALCAGGTLAGWRPSFAEIADESIDSP